MQYQALTITEDSVRRVARQEVRQELQRLGLIAPEDVDWTVQFLEALERHGGNVRAAAGEVEPSVAKIYNYRSRYLDFRRAWAAAVRRGKLKRKKK